MGLVTLRPRGLQWDLRFLYLCIESRTASVALPLKHKQKPVNRVSNQSVVTSVNVIRLWLAVKQKYRKLIFVNCLFSQLNGNNSSIVNIKLLIRICIPSVYDISVIDWAWKLNLLFLVRVPKA